MKTSRNKKVKANNLLKNLDKFGWERIEESKEVRLVKIITEGKKIIVNKESVKTGKFYIR
ncbi:hypothetical protein [Bacteroides sp. 519]|uniref:hypothetical protein n=1 Tax=Bacteroides sp. 519 TaxID=2302937 RepID=UPI0013D031AE|nr:hypothetical protein [Bacteroides sp. 519]